MPLTFDADTHTYTIDGVVLPSVTQVLGDVFYTPGAEWFTDEARLRGSYVHAAIALDHEGALDEDTVDYRLFPYIEAWRAFKRESDFRPMAWEQAVCDPARGYAGTYDVIGQLGDNPLFPPVLVDFKTGTPAEWIRLQTAAYARVAKGDRFPTLRRGGLWLRADGTYRFTMHTDRADERLFLSALEVFQWKQKLS